jgi:hypothetical protein
MCLIMCRAFEKLAEPRFVVIKLQYRAVDCSHQPEEKAWIDNPSPPIPKQPPSGIWFDHSFENT